MSHYYCPNCGASNPASAIRCYNCGAPNPTAPATDATSAVATNPFEAPTQPQSPYQAPSYPPPIPPSAYGVPPAAPYQPPLAATPPAYVPPAYGQPLYGQVGYQNPQFSAESQRWQTRARTALILGIAGLLCCGLLGPVALSFGIQSKNGLQRLGVTDGQGMALAGIILGSVATALWLLAMLVGLFSG